MSSSFTTLVRRGHGQEVYSTSGWAEAIVAVPLELGEHRLSLTNGQPIRLPPATVLRLHLAPNTRLRVDSDTDADVEWGFLITSIDSFAASPRT